MILRKFNSLYKFTAILLLISLLYSPIKADEKDIQEIVKEDLFKQIPLGRIGKPSDIATAVLYLASDEAGYITGQTLTIDGGMTSF